MPSPTAVAVQKTATAASTPAAEVPMPVGEKLNHAIAALPRTAGAVAMKHTHTKKIGRILGLTWPKKPKPHMKPHSSGVYVNSVGLSLSCVGHTLYGLFNKLTK